LNQIVGLGASRAQLFLTEEQSLENRSSSSGASQIVGFKLRGAARWILQNSGDPLKMLSIGWKYV
jgi:hypothetical protein